MSTTSPPRPREVGSRLGAFHRTKLAFLAAGFVSLLLSVLLWATDRPQEAIFVGLWVPAIHSLGALLLMGERGRP
jgi:hypothetical protein